ncbi:MAG: rhomboid family intramembrane serine protease [Pseudomonadales bacterium]|nr:rhomboid family intramembrane serine protease [Pseudomonadales bacterium]
MFPLYDDNIRLRWPVVTALLIALNLLVWLLLQGMGMEQPLARSLCLHGLIPADLLGTAPLGSRIPLTSTLSCVIDGESSWTSLFSSMFMHAGWLHLLGNLWFLWVFGDNVEDVMGAPRYLLFYLLAGLAAAVAQILTDPASTVPMVGASGAIGGVMGAYARMFPRAQVQTLFVLVFYFFRVALPAVVLLGYWLLLQIAGSLLAPQSGGGVAFWAHIGGFAGGMLLSFVMVSPARLATHKRLQAERALLVDHAF